MLIDCLHQNLPELPKHNYLFQKKKKKKSKHFVPFLEIPAEHSQGNCLIYSQEVL